MFELWQQKLAIHLVNRDGAGMVAERLDQARIVGLNRWFRHERGGDCGRFLLLAAPLFDTALAKELEPLRERRAPGFREDELYLFGLGALLGVRLLEPRREELFGSSLAFGCALRELAGLDPATSARAPEPAVFVAQIRQLIRMDERLGLVLETLVRLARHTGEELEYEDRGLEGRLLLLAGLLGAGVEAPPVPAGAAPLEDDECDSDASLAGEEDEDEFLG